MKKERTHGKAIAALRKEALKCEKRAQDPIEATGFSLDRVGRREYIDWRFQKRARAAAMSIAAEHLDAIVGASERPERPEAGRGKAR
jgi:hypothetical protein